MKFDSTGSNLPRMALCKQHLLLCIFLLLTSVFYLPFSKAAATSNSDKPQLQDIYIQFDLKVLTPSSAMVSDWRLKVEAGLIEQAAEYVLDADVEFAKPPVVGEWRTFRVDLYSLSRLGTGINLEAIDKILIFPRWGTGEGVTFRVDNLHIGSTKVDRKLWIFDGALQADWPAWDCCGGSHPVLIDSKTGRGSVIEFSVNNGNTGTVLGFNTLAANSPQPFNVLSFMGRNDDKAEQGMTASTVKNANVYFKYISTEELNSIGTIYSIVKDSQGFMWFGGSDGLARYDGYSLKIYKHNVNDPDSISSNAIWDMLIDSQNRFWIATDIGLNLFDPKTQRFSHFLHDPEDESSISHNIVKTLIEDSRGDLWVGTFGGGVNRLNQDTLQFTRFLNDPDNPASLSNNAVNDIYEDRDGLLWIATNKGLNVYNPEQNTFAAYFNYWGDSNSIDDNGVRTIIEDEYERLWVGTHSGLNLFDRATKKVTRVKFGDFNKVDVVDIALGREQRLWISSGEALLIFDPQQATFSTFEKDVINKGSFNGEFPTSVYRDDSDNWWVGAFPSGINYVDSSKSEFFTYQYDPQDNNTLSHNSVLSITEDDNGNLWVGTDGGGLNYLNRTTGTVEHITHQESDTEGLFSNAVLSTGLDPNGNIWIGHWHAPLSIYSPEKSSFVHHTSNRDGIKLPSSLYVWTTYLDSRGDMWLATISDGLFRYNAKRQTYDIFEPIEDDPNSFGSRFVWSIFEDSSGTMWFGTSDGLVRHNHEQDNFTTFTSDPNKASSLSNEVILDIHEDPDGILWIGTRGGGANRYDSRDGSFTHISVAQGLPDSVVTGILSDEQGYLWLSTFNGLCRYDRDLKNCSNFTNLGALQSNKFNIGAATRLSTGELAFGNTDGLLIFDPQKVAVESEEPPIALTQFQIANREVTLAQVDSPLNQDISVTNNLVLTHEQSMFSIAFAALAYQNPEKNKYAYFLDGYDTQWNEIGNRRRATYTNLDPGDYVFKVRGTNSQGLWSSEPRMLNITVLPPPWRSWWAYTIYVLVFLIIAFLITHLQVRKLQERRQLKLALWASGDEMWDVDLAKKKVFRQNYLDYLEEHYLDTWLHSDLYKSNIHPEDVEKVQAILDKKLNKEHAFFEVSYRARTKAGEWVWLLDRGQVTSWNRDGEATRVSGTTKNIHELKSAEAKLVTLNQELEQRVERRTEELEQSNEFLRSTQAQLVESEKMASLGTLVVGVSHELNTPIGIAVTALSNLKHQLSNFVDLIDEGKLSKSSFSKFKDNASLSAEHAYDSMSKCIDIIQNFKKISVDQETSELTTKRLIDLVEDSIVQAGLVKGSKGLKQVSLDCDNEIEITTYADILTATLKELLKNAQQHAYSAGQATTVKIVVAVSADRVEISVIDNGKGMKEEDVASIFDPFFTSERGTNVGLGLFVVYNQVQHLLNGEINCQSSLGQGSTFCLSLPLKTQKSSSNEGITSS